MNEFEERARVNKAMRLVDAIDQTWPPVLRDPDRCRHVADIVAGFTAKQWAALVLQAGVKPPSILTRALVVSTLTARAVNAQKTADGLFDGLDRGQDAF